jgi:hypothetical protein
VRRRSVSPSATPRASAETAAKSAGFAPNLLGKAGRFFSHFA